MLKIYVAVVEQMWCYPRKSYENVGVFQNWLYLVYMSAILDCCNENERKRGSI